MEPDGGDRKLSGVLGDLIEVERRIEAEIAEAEAEAERIVEAARGEAEAGERDGDAAREAAVAALRESIEDECAAALRSIEARALREIERYRRVDDAAVEELARWLADRVAGGGSDA